jgi:hypothetical protein
MENKFVVEAELLRGTGALKEIHQVRTTAEQHMLAVVNRLAFTRRQERRSPSAQHCPLLEEIDLETGFGQPERGGHARQPAA